jgi:PAS domain-containing protein
LKERVSRQAIVGGAYLAFVLDWRGLSSANILLYLPAPFLIWAALRFGPLETSAASFVVSMMVTFGALYGRGPFAATSSDSVVLAVQLFLLVPSIVILFLAVLGQQQRQTHAALKESELRFRSLVDAAPVMVWMSDTAGLCTFVNKHWLDFTGVPLESQLGEAWLERVHPEDRDSGQDRTPSGVSGAEEPDIGIQASTIRRRASLATRQRFSPIRIGWNLSWAHRKLHRHLTSQR